MARGFAARPGLNSTGITTKMVNTPNASVISAANPAPNRSTGQNAAYHATNMPRLMRIARNTVTADGMYSTPGWSSDTYRLPFSSTNRRPSFPFG